MGKTVKYECGCRMEITKDGTKYVHPKLQEMRDKVLGYMIICAALENKVEILEHRLECFKLSFGHQPSRKRRKR